MNVKMPIIVGILTFISRINFVLRRVEHEKSFITSGPGVVVRSKAVVLLLLICCLLLVPLWGFSVCSMFCCAVFCALSCFTIILIRKREVDALRC